MNNKFARMGLSLTLFLSALSVYAEEEKVLNVYNWTDYVAEDTISNFEKETGIKVKYDMFTSNEVLESRLTNGSSGYDVVVPSSQFLARQIRANIFQTLDKSKLTNLKNIDPAMLQILAANDPNNEHGIPYLWGTTGLGFNKTALVAALGDSQPLDTWNLLFDPKIAAKLKNCGISMLDAPDEVMRTALFYKGLDPNSNNPKDYEGPAVDTMMAVRPFIRSFNSSQYIDDFASGNLCLALGWPGDITIASTKAKENKKTFELAYVIPKEGAAMWFDMMAIPADAKHPQNALLFINYIMQPQVIAAVSNYVGYANPNMASTQFVDTAITSNPNVYPPANVKSKLFALKMLSPETSKAMTRSWIKIKSGI